MGSILTPHNSFYLHFSLNSLHNLKVVGSIPPPHISFPLFFPFSHSLTRGRVFDSHASHFIFINFCTLLLAIPPKIYTPWPHFPFNVSKAYTGEDTGSNHYGLILLHTNNLKIYSSLFSLNQTCRFDGKSIIFHLIFTKTFPWTLREIHRTFNKFWGEFFL